MNQHKHICTHCLHNEIESGNFMTLRPAPTCATICDYCKSVVDKNKVDLFTVVNEHSPWYGFLTSETLR